MKTMPTQSQVRYKGNVIQKRVSPGSKSDRVAVLLQTEDQELILRRKDGNPFKDKSWRASWARTSRRPGFLPARR